MAEIILLGQTDDAAAPAAAAGKLYRRAQSYGTSTGTDVPLLVETPNHAPVGPVGRFAGRFLSVPFTYDNAFSAKVTPIVDENTELASKTQSFAAPAVRRVGRIKMPFFRAMTVFRARVEIVTRSGPVDVHTPQLAGTVITGAHPSAGGQTQ